MNSEKCLDEYLIIADSLLASNIDNIKYYTNYLSKNIQDWAIENSLVYHDLRIDVDKIYTKNDLLNKDQWYIKSLKDSSVVSSTNGSTTGDPFSYAIYKKYVPFLMDDQHWSLILKEFNLYNDHINICIFYSFKDTANIFTNSLDFLCSDHNVSNQSQYNHGSKNCSIDYINFKAYGTDQWYDKVFEYFSSKSVDVVISTGPIINQLCREIRKRKYDKKICYLLSHSNEFPRSSDFEFLKNNKHIDHHCDHMRCWDGGAAFFTCKYGTYHLLDNITYHKSIDNKLVTTDYFSLAAPFINYWNGDLCEIDDEYKLCECGRYYRPFKMLENRPFALKGPTKLTDIKKQIGVLEYKGKIDQVQFENLSANIYIKEKLNDDEKQTLQHILQDYEVNFYDL